MKNFGPPDPREGSTQAVDPVYADGLVFVDGRLKKELFFLPSVIEIASWRRLRLSCVLGHNVVSTDASWTEMAGGVSLYAAVFWDVLQAHMLVVPLTCPTWFLALCLSCDAQIKPPISLPQWSFS